MWKVCAVSLLENLLDFELVFGQKLEKYTRNLYMVETVLVLYTAVKKILEKVNLNVWGIAY